MARLVHLAFVGLLAVSTVVALRPGASAPVPPMPVSPAAPLTAPPASSENDDVTYESGPARYLDKDKLWQMSGGVKFTQDEMHLDTKAALVNLDKDLNAVSAKSLSPVHMYDPDNDLTGDWGYVDFTHHMATLRDHITLIARPSKQPSTGSLKSQQKSPAVVTCALMTYDYNTKHGAIPGPLVVHEDDRTLTADTATYDGVGKTVTLTGNVHVQQGGNEVFADKVIAGVASDNQWIDVPGQLHGKFKPKSNTETAPAKPSPSAPPPDLDLPAGSGPPDQTGSSPLTPAASSSGQPSTGAGSQPAAPGASPTVPSGGTTASPQK